MNGANFSAGSRSTTLDSFEPPREPPPPEPPLYPGPDPDAPPPPPPTPDAMTTGRSHASHCLPLSPARLRCASSSS